MVLNLGSIAGNLIHLKNISRPKSLNKLKLVFGLIESSHYGKNKIFFFRSVHKGLRVTVKNLQIL